MTHMIQVVEQSSDRSALRGLRRYFRTWEGALGAALLGLTLLIIVVGPMLAPYPPNELGAGLPNQGPSAMHFLGTDWLGRDVLSRFLVGGRQVLFIPILATVLAYVVAGLIAGYAVLRGGQMDAWASRFFDALLALPPMLLGLVLLGSVGNSWGVMLGLLILVTFPRAGRVIRGVVDAAKSMDYVQSAVGRGERTLYIVRQEITPNIALPVLADFGVRLTYTIIFASSLSFLGFGTQPPDADWGRMIFDSVPFLLLSPWGSMAPAIGITLAAVSVNFMAEGLGRIIADDGRRSKATRRRKPRAKANRSASERGSSS